VIDIFFRYIQQTQRKKERKKDQLNAQEYRSNKVYRLTINSGEKKKSNEVI